MTAFFLHGHEVDGYDDAHDQVGGQVDDAADTAPDAAGQGPQRRLRPGQDVLLQQGHAIAVILCDKVGDPHRHLVLAVQQTVSPVIFLVIIRLSVVDEHGHAVDKLGDQHAHQQGDQQNAEKPQDASGVLQVLFGKNPLPRSVEYPLDPVHHRRQQVCDDRAVYHRRQHGGQLAHELLQCTAHIKCVVKNQHGADGQKRRQPPLQVLCPVLHAHHSFSGLAPPIIADPPRR